MIARADAQQFDLALGDDRGDRHDAGADDKEANAARSRARTSTSPWFIVLADRFAASSSAPLRSDRQISRPDRPRARRRFWRLRELPRAAANWVGSGSMPDRCRPPPDAARSSRTARFGRGSPAPALRQKSLSRIPIAVAVIDLTTIEWGGVARISCVVQHRLLEDFGAGGWRRLGIELDPRRSCRECPGANWH